MNRTDPPPPQNALSPEPESLHPERPGPAGPGPLPDLAAARAWMARHRIEEVEAMVADMAGIARGKILPTRRFLSSAATGALRLPDNVFAQTVTGDYIEESAVLEETEPDVVLIPDLATLRPVPWHDEPTAQVICDAVNADGPPFGMAPRQVLKRVIALYEARGWRPVVAPELEFYLAKKNVDADYPLEPPEGRSGRPETGRQSYGIDAVNEFDPIFEEMYDFCEQQGLDVDTLIHESGAAQVEINFDHGDPLALADQVFVFKRTVRQTAIRHGIYATFMAKPYETEPGSAMHIHQSVVDIETGENLLADDDGNDTALFHAMIGGLQRFMPAAMPFFAPYVNSYRRVVKYNSAPINTHWGRENRTVGLRVPASGRTGRRIENRVPGADANPYLAIAASLVCGWLGMTRNLRPTAPLTTSAYEIRTHALPRHILDGLSKLRNCDELHEHLGEDFVALFLEVKMAEHEAYQQVISPWEREHLLLNV